MNFWEEVVNSETIPTDEAEKLRYNSARLTGAALVQEYHVMIQEGLTYSCLSTGIALVFLYVPEEDPNTLYYYLCVPNMDVPPDGEGYASRPVTAVARLLCLSLMSCATSLRSNAWRNTVKDSVKTWKIDFEYTRSQIPDEQLNKTPPCSEYVPSSPIDSPEEGGPRRSKRLRPGCTPSPDVDRDDPSDTSDSDPHIDAPRRKRNYSKLASSPSQPLVRRPGPSQSEGGQIQHTASAFCTQRCLLGLQQGGLLDDTCPNISDHRRGRQTDKHLVNAAEMVDLLKQQLDIDVDSQCIPFGSCGASGAAFKLRCISHGYTIVGKGTTSWLWNGVSREANFYEVLHGVQGSAVPVFLGTIDLKQTYFLHGAGEIQHMLLMAWGGETLTKMQWHARLTAIDKSRAEIRKLGVRHGDVRPENLLWNEELGRVLLIDFHKSELINRQTGLLKRTRELPSGAGIRARKRRRLGS
ncbi:hypothetical protein LTR08_005108 [Meristemomyces frigidus]|nr:hypothetical protein LTR08_005108 [Meristemomyces frigidus]